MRRLSVFVEINGESVYVGEIAGKDSTDACFTYADTYLKNPEHYAISIGLPLEEKTFDAARTKLMQNKCRIRNNVSWLLDSICDRTEHYRF